MIPTDNVTLKQLTFMFTCVIILLIAMEPGSIFYFVVCMYVCVRGGP
jgi:hypothetical protein